MGSQRRTPASRWKAGDPAESDATLDEVLRQIDADILGEPVPEKLRRILRRAQGRSGQESAADDQDRTTGHR